METVKNFETGTNHIVKQDNEEKAVCGRGIEWKAVGGWGNRKERDNMLENMCGECLKYYEGGE